MRRVNRTVRITICVTAGSLLGAVLLYASSDRAYDIDINSGRERTYNTACGLRWGTAEYETPLSRFFAEGGQLPETPDWHRYHLDTGPSGPRINYRYGGLVSDLRTSLTAMDLAERYGKKLEEKDRRMLSELARASLKAGNRFPVELQPDGGFRVLDHNQGTVLFEFPHETSR
jgi:hypothetical protein